MPEWIEAKAYEDITYHKADGMARIAFNRPEVRNAFRPKTIDEMIDALARNEPSHASNQSALQRQAEPAARLRPIVGDEPVGINAGRYDLDRDVADDFPHALRGER